MQGLVDLSVERWNRATHDVAACTRLIEAHPRPSTPELDAAVRAATAAAVRVEKACSLAQRGFLRRKYAELAKARAIPAMSRFVEAFDRAYPDLAAIRRQETKRGR